MAKTMYCTNTAALAHRGTNSANLAGTAVFWTAKLLSENHGTDTTGTLTQPCTTVTGPTNGIEVGGTTPFEWISEPLSADFTISGTITLNLWAKESNASANAAINAAIDKIDGATGAVTRIATSVRVTELTTSIAANNFTVTPTSTACNRGDRIRVRVFADDAGTMGSGLVVNFYFDRSTAAQGESFVTFTENLTFEPGGDPQPSMVYSQLIHDSSDSFDNPLSSAVQPFVANGTTLTDVSVWLSKQGAPSDTVVVEVRTDSGGNPTSTVVATVGTFPGSSITGGAPQQVSFSALSITLTVGTLYHLLMRRSGTTDTSNYYQPWTANSPQVGWLNAKDGLSTGGFLPANGPLGVILGYVALPYYLTDVAQKIDPGAAVEKRASTTRGSGSVNAVTNTAAGATAGIQITASGGGSAIEWYTPPLMAITLGGKAKFNIRALESAATINASLRAEIAVCNKDGSSPVVWGISNLEAFTSNGSVGELPTADGVVAAWVAGDDLAITTGQRLRFRIYVDDCGDAALVTAGTATVSYNGTTTAAAGDTYVMLPVAVIEAASSLVAPARREQLNRLTRWY